MMLNIEARTEEYALVEKMINQVYMVRKTPRGVLVGLSKER